MDFGAEQGPPLVQVCGQVLVFLRRVGLAGDRVEVDHPRLQVSDEMEDLHVLAESADRKR